MAADNTARCAPGEGGTVCDHADRYTVVPRHPVEFAGGFERERHYTVEGRAYQVCPRCGVQSYSEMLAGELRERNRQYPRHLQRVPEALWPPIPASHNRPIEVWRSRTSLVMVYLDGGHERLSVVRAALGTGFGWQEGIAWDDLQRLKRECGRGDRWAVEVFPPDSDVVNVSNMRHLWMLVGPPAYGWRADGRVGEEK